MTSQNNYVPKDYNDLYRYYIMGSGRGNSLTSALIRKFLPYADEDERETLAHDVFVRCMEKDVLKIFDPTKANFGGVIYFVTRSVCSNHLGKKSRNPLTGLKGGTLTESDSDEEGFEPGVYHLDRLFAAEGVDPDAALDAGNLLGLLFNKCKQLAEKPKANKQEQSLYPLLGLLGKQADTAEMAAELGVTTSTVHNWIMRLQELVEEIKAEWLTPRKRASATNPMPTEQH